MTDSSYPPYAGKRALDLAIMLVLGVPAALIGVVCAIAVRLTSKGPVFFLQSRVGMDGKDFQVYKFRTMVDDVNPVIPDPTRITSAGKLLRRLSLDELPQLINVAKGDMSIVGPRPTLRYQVERYDENQAHRLDVRPGLTGLAQIRGRNALDWNARIEHDLEYVRTQSLRLDLEILWKTAAVVLSGEGAEGHPVNDPIVKDDE